MFLCYPLMAAAIQRPSLSLVFRCSSRLCATISPKPAHLAKTDGEHKLLHKLQPDSPHDSRILKVALLGVSNSGKSTLMNALMGRRVSSVAATFHTTRRNMVALLVTGETQVVLLDTPGIFSDASAAKYDVERKVRTDAFAAVDKADLVAVLVDAGNVWTRSSLSKDIMKTLARHQAKPSVLVLNKVDLVQSKTDLLTLTRVLTGNMVGGLVATNSSLSRGRRRQDIVDLGALFAKYDAKLAVSGRLAPLKAAAAVTTGGVDTAPTAVHGHSSKAGMWPHFDTVFMVSSLLSDGISDLREYLIGRAKPGPWLYHSSLVTDQEPSEIVELCLREAFLKHLPQEIPFTLQTEITDWKPSIDSLAISVAVMCKNKGTFSITMGKDGSTIRQISVKAENDLTETFGCPVTLRLGLKML